MNRKFFLLLIAAFGLCCAGAASAQMGMNFFKKPNIADIFRPEVGKGGVWEISHAKRDKPDTLDWYVVGKESVAGKDGYWVEMSHADERSGQPSYYKMLVTKDDFQFHRVIMQMPGMPAMEMPWNPSDKTRTRMDKELEKWSRVGTESITVPAGTFSCQHWKKNEGTGDVWASEKISPIGVVKMVNSDETMTLVKITSDATEHITGPVQPFDPQAFRRMLKAQPQH